MLDRTIAPPVHLMGNLSLPVPHTQVLPNGVTLQYISEGSQEVNQLSLVWPGGASESHNPIIAKIMGNLLREGTKQMSGVDISEAFDFNGAMYRTLVDSHYTTINLSSLNSKTVNVLPIVRDIICNATLPEAPFNTFRDIEVQDYRLSRANVLNLAMEAVAPLIKGIDHPQSKVWDAEARATVTLDEVRGYYDRVFTASGCHALLSGHIDNAILHEVRSMLCSMPAPSAPVQLSLIPFQPQAPGMVVVDKPGAQQAAVCMALPAPHRRHPDYVPLRLTVTALGGYFGSRLMKNVREDKGYTYGIGAYLLGAQEGSYILISAQTDRKYVDKLIDEVRNELVAMSTLPLDVGELMRLKQYVSSNLMETLDSPFSIMDYYRTILCVGIADDYFESQVDWLRRIDASTIQLMAHKYLQPDTLRIAVCQ